LSLNGHSDIADEIRRGLRNLNIAVAAVALGLVVLVLLGYRDSINKRRDLERVATTNESALCSLRNDISDRVHTQQKLLIRHPHGLAGISAATIRANIAGQKRTIHSLDILECPR
jgi:hypothetical protein